MTEGSGQMRMEKRHTGIELLRIVAMLMIVIMHFLSHSGNLLEPGTPFSLPAAAGTILENLCLGAVNAYVFISGYYGSRRSYKPSKAVRLLCQIWFYSLLIPLILLLFHQQTKFQEGVYGVISYLLPIETEHYWFATSFLMLMLFSPFLNQAVKFLSRKKFQIALVGIFVLFSGIKSICPIAFGFDKYGYDLPWFLFVYLFAAYAGKYDSQGFLAIFKENRKKAALLFLLSAGVGMVIQFLMRDLGQLIPALEGTCNYYFTVPYHYNAINVFAGSIGLFYLFQSMEIKEGKLAEGIRKVSGLSFGVYLLHEHIDIRGYWYGWLKGIINRGNQSGLLYFFIELIFCVIVVFAAGILIDFLRRCIFKVVANAIKNTRLHQAMTELDEVFSREMLREGEHHGTGN